MANAPAKQKVGDIFNVIDLDSTADNHWMSMFKPLSFVLLFLQMFDLPKNRMKDVQINVRPMIPITPILQCQK